MKENDFKKIKTTINNFKEAVDLLFKLRDPGFPFRFAQMEKQSQHQIIKEIFPDVKIGSDDQFRL